MSVVRPIGPEPPFVYWVRRASVLLVLVTIIAILVWLIAGRGSDEGSTPADDASALPTANASAAVTSAASAPASAVPVGDPLPCGPGDILVEATTDSTTYRVGETPRLTLTITNTSSLPCTRDVGPKVNELKISSGGYHVWSSDDCGASDESKIVTIEPGEKVASTITWKGRLSEPGCPTEGEAAKAGRYEVVGRNGKIESDGTLFALTSKN